MTELCCYAVCLNRRAAITVTPVVDARSFKLTHGSILQPDQDAASAQHSHEAQALTSSLPAKAQAY